MDKGLLYGGGAYFLWALFPLYFKLLQESPALEIIGYRVVCSLLFCVLLLALARQWGEVREVLANRRATLMLAVAGVLVTANWTFYVVGVNSGRTLDAALGYFINPLVAAVLGVVVLGERLTRVQWGAFAVGAVACVVLVLGYGQVPWIAFGVASTFGVYGLIKKRVGAKVPALVGLGVETAAVTPVMLGYLVWLGAAGAATADPGTGYGWLMYLSGPITAVPLLLFAAGAKRLRLVTMGMIQYIAPIGQFLLGWLVFGEPMPAERWVGFALVWVALVMFVASAVSRTGREGRQPE
ncbi:EamA family transporter RarD [Tessaracoccus terricola]